MNISLIRNTKICAISLWIGIGVISSVLPAWKEPTFFFSHPNRPTDPTSAGWVLSAHHTLVPISITPSYQSFWHSRSGVLRAKSACLISHADTIAPGASLGELSVCGISSMKQKWRVRSPLPWRALIVSLVYTQPYPPAQTSYQPRGAIFWQFYRRYGGQHHKFTCFKYKIQYDFQ